MTHSTRRETSIEAERFQLLVEGISDYAIYMLDPDGTVASWNTGAQRFKGYTPEEIIGQHFSQFYTDEDRLTNLPARALKQAEEEGKFEQEGWRVRKDGSRMWAHVVIDPIRDKKGTLVGFAKITRDLTERKAAAEALRRSDEQFRMLVNSVTDYAIYMLSPEGKVTSWNAGAQRIKGYEPDEIIGQHFSTFYTEEDIALGMPQRVLDTAAKEGRYEKEGWRVRKDGTRFLAHVIVDPIRGENGELVGFAKVTRDITERHQAQKELERAREAFFQSQKAEALGQLTGGVAHDFNNLLMVIMSSLEMASKRLPDDPKLRRLINNAVQGAQRGASLTQRMLSFARRQELKLEPVRPKELVAGMLDLLERSIGPAISIQTSVPGNLASTLADPNQLELSILNLAVNARDAMPQGGTISIAARQAFVTQSSALGIAAGEYVCISVTDDGEGMDEATLARATEPFFTTKGVGKGTGLGLSMVHGMAQQLGGTLVIASHIGKGTTAELWLPALPSAQAAMPGTDQDAAMVSPDRGSAVILVVDDDPLVLGNVREMLEDLGYEALVASSGKEALDMFQRSPIDLLLTDHAMPNMTGVELVKKLREARPDLRAILASGYADIPIDDQDVALLRLNKPFLQSALADAVTEALS
jgi:PAS domain S-box-containing protein